MNGANNADTTEEKILSFIKNNGVVSASQIQHEFGFKSRTSVQRILTKMLFESKIQKTGTGKNTVYSLENQIMSKLQDFYGAFANRIMNMLFFHALKKTAGFMLLVPKLSVKLKDKKNNFLNVII